MKLYIVDNYGKKVYLNYEALTRRQLARKIKSEVFTLKGIRYSVKQVRAELGSSPTVPGLLIGGVIGLLAGPLGAITGGAVGGLIGKNAENEDIKKVNRFNKSL